MIRADIAKLQAEREKLVSAMLEKELVYLNQDLTGMTASAALIAGFAFSQLDNESQAVAGDSIYIRGLHLSYHIGVTLTLCTNLMVVANSTFLSVFGPNFALRTNNEASLQQAINSLRAERESNLGYLLRGIIFFLVTSILQMWRVWKNFSDPAICTLLIVSGGVYYTFFIYARMARKFDVGSLVRPKVMQKWAKGTLNPRVTSGDLDATNPVLHEGYLTMLEDSNRGKIWTIKYFQLTWHR
jgi:hypothetical protein